MQDLKRAAREAFARGEQLERQLLARYPGAWRQMDAFRADPPMPWPGWCLLPMGAAATVALGPRSPDMRVPLEIPPIAGLSALYAWRFSRSVYLFHPDLAGQLASTVPDLPDLDLLARMPDWCVLVSMMDVEWPGAGVWMHLEHDVNTGRPELRLLLDTVVSAPVEIPVYLDRGSVTEALADYAATTRATGLPGERLRPGQDVRGGELTSESAVLSEKVDVWIALLSYLCRTEADIVELGRPGVRPSGRARSPRRGRTTWLVGYSGR